MKRALIAVIGLIVSANHCLAEYPIRLNIVTLDVDQRHYDSVLAVIGADTEPARCVDGGGGWYEPYGVVNQDNVSYLVRLFLRRDLVRVSSTESDNVCKVPNGPAGISPHDSDRIDQPIISVFTKRFEDGSIHVFAKRDTMVPGRSMGPGPFRQRVLPRQTLILETDWNVPQPEPARKKLLGWVPSPRLPKKRARGPRRLVLLTPADYYAEQYARARLTGDPVVKDFRIEWGAEPRTPSSTDTPQIQALLQAVLYLQQSGHREEAATVYAEVTRLRHAKRVQAAVQTNLIPRQ